MNNESHLNFHLWALTPTDKHVIDCLQRLFQCLPPSLPPSPAQKSFANSEEVCSLSDFCLRDNSWHDVPTWPRSMFEGIKSAMGLSCRVYYHLMIAWLSEFRRILLCTLFSAYKFRFIVGSLEFQYYPLINIFIQTTGLKSS